MGTASESPAAAKREQKRKCRPSARLNSLRAPKPPKSTDSSQSNSLNIDSEIAFLLLMRAVKVSKLRKGWHLFDFNTQNFNSARKLII